MSTDPQVDLHFRQAIDRLQQGQFEQAKGYLLLVLAKQPKHFDALQFTASAHANLGEFSQAAHFFEQALSIKKNNPKVFNNFGFVLSKLGEFEQAMKMYDKAIKLDSLYLDALNNLANLHQQLGAFQQSIDIYTRLLKINPRFVQAHFNKGVAHQQMGHFDLAINAYDKALELEPKYTDALLNKAACLKELSEFNQALVIYNHLLTCLSPDATFEVHNNLGNLLKLMGRAEDALGHYDQAVMVNPYNSVSYSNRGNVLLELNRLEESLNSFHVAITLSKLSADYYSNRGSVYERLNQFVEAEKDFNQAICLDPAHTKAYYNKANLFKQRGNFALAKSAYERSVSIQPLNPLNADAYNNLGNLYKDLNLTDAALNSYEHALRCDPKHLESILNKGVVYQSRLKLSEALNCFEQVLRLDPNHSKAHVNKAIVLLLQGQFNEAWASYEHRLTDPALTPKPLKSSKPMLQTLPLGSVLRILLWSEQGVGDEVMFASMFSELTALGHQLICQIDPRLIGLFERSFPGVQFLSKEGCVDAELYDAHLPFASLVRILNLDATGLRSLKNPYLVSDSLKSKELRRTIQESSQRAQRAQCTNTQTAKKPPLICGVSWRTTNPKNGAERSLGIKTLINSIACEGVVFVNLQYQVNSPDGQAHLDLADLQEYERRGEWVNTGIDNLNDLDGFSSLIQACDVVISIDNSTLHFSGALGKTTWALIPYSPDWRWLTECRDSYWYPSMELFRQTRPGEWTDPLERIKLALLHKVSTQLRLAQ